MKNDGTCYWVGFYNIPRDIDSPKCRSWQQAACLAIHYQIDELCCDGICREYVVRSASRKNIYHVV